MAASSGKTSPRGRPTPMRASLIDQLIRQSALELFLEAGFESVTMEAIAQRAGVSKGTLYTRHASKAELLRTILNEQVADWSRRAGNQDHLLPRDLRGRLRAHARTIISSQDWSEIKQLDRLIAEITDTFPDLARAYHEITLKSFLRFLAEDMEKATAPSALGTNDWEFFAKLFLYSISGWHRAESTMRAVREDEVIAFSDQVIETIAAAVRARQQAN